MQGTVPITDSNNRSSSGGVPLQRRDCSLGHAQDQPIHHSEVLEWNELFSGEKKKKIEILSWRVDGWWSEWAKRGTIRESERTGERERERERCVRERASKQQYEERKIDLSFLSRVHGVSETYPTQHALCIHQHTRHHQHQTIGWCRCRHLGAWDTTSTDRARDI